MPPLQLSFVKSADLLDQLAEGGPEVAIVGRSNVGKSSLLNALANRKQLARTSGTPGRTQLLNQFALDSGGIVVDLPGYGYAKAPEPVRRAWKARMEGYLAEREQLRLVLVLVDGAVGPTKLDQEMLAFLRGHTRPIQVVATKYDKVKPSQRVKRAKEVATGCGVGRDDIVWVSATKGDGLDQLRGIVRGALAG